MNKPHGQQVIVGPNSFGQWRPVNHLRSNEFDPTGG